jgi:hypothetical protein
MAGFRKNELVVFGFSAKDAVVPLANELSHMLSDEDGIPIKPEKGSIGASVVISIKSSPSLGWIEDESPPYPDARPGESQAS